MRGKLVEQDPYDEPASELLKRIKKEKVRLVKVGEIKKSKQNQPGLTDPPFGIPANWEWAAFGQVHQLIRGVTYSRADVSDGSNDGFVPILRANNIRNILTHDEPVYVKRDRVSADQFLKKADFMIALSSGSKNLVGKAAFVPENFKEAFGGFCGVIRLFDRGLQGFSRVYLQSDLYRESMSAGSRGIGINNLKKETLSHLFFPLPPLAEQHRIVAKVDELMALCDQLVASIVIGGDTRHRLLEALLHEALAPSENEIQQDISTIAPELPDEQHRPHKVLTKPTPAGTSLE